MIASFIKFQSSNKSYNMVSPCFFFNASPSSRLPWSLVHPSIIPISCKAMACCSDVGPTTPLRRTTTDSGDPIPSTWHFQPSSIHPSLSNLKYFFSSALSAKQPTLLPQTATRAPPPPPLPLSKWLASSIHWQRPHSSTIAPRTLPYLRIARRRYSSRRNVSRRPPACYSSSRSPSQPRRT